MLKNTVAVCVVLALCVLHSANAIKCYQCKSFSDPNCANEKIDSSSNVRVTDCNTVPRPNTQDNLLPVTKCNKVVTKDKAGLIVSRDCHFEVVGQNPNTCTVSHSTQIEKCYICSGDLCNASSAGRFIAVGITALLAVVVAQLAL